MAENFHLEAEADWRPRATSLRNKCQQAVLHASLASLLMARDSMFTKAVAIAWQAQIIQQLVDNYRQGIAQDGYTPEIHAANFGTFT